MFYVPIIDSRIQMIEGKQSKAASLQGSTTPELTKLPGIAFRIAVIGAFLPDLI